MSEKLHYGIYMHTAYLTGSGWIEDIELWSRNQFDDIEEACKWLGRNADKLCYKFPIESFEIKLIKPESFEIKLIKPSNDE